MTSLKTWLYEPILSLDKKQVLQEAMILESDECEVLRAIGLFIKRAFIYREKTEGSEIPHNPYDTNHFRVTT